MELGAGEILLTSMDRDGTGKGFNLALTRAIADAVTVPVIASGGVGTLDHLVEGIRDGHATAVLAASIFHFGTYTIAQAKSPYGSAWHSHAPGVRSRGSTMSHNLQTLADLADAIAKRRGESPDQSYTAKLLSQGVEKCAKKFGEEAVELALASMKQDKAHVTAEAADVLYHLLVLLAASDVPLSRRHGRTGTPQGHERPCRKSRAGKDHLMETLARAVSPFRRFDRDEWSKLRADTPMTLTQVDLDELRGLNDKIDLQEVETIYLPLSRLLNLYVAATQKLFRATNNFLHSEDRKVPYVIGIAGSVAVGKSTTARILRRLLSRWPHHPKVDLVTTDGFLLPNAVLEREGLMARKGFPESYDLPSILRFMSDIKAGKPQGHGAALFASHL